MSLEFESTFIDHTLREWGALVDEKLKAALKEKGVGSTNELSQSIRFQIMPGSGTHKGSYHLIFQEQGRFVDMGAGRKAKGLQSETNKRAVIDRSNRNSRKPKKWYSKTFYSQVGILVSRLSKNYAEYAAQQIKQQQS